MGTTRDIRGAVEAELDFGPLVDNADIDIVNIFGDMALNGTLTGMVKHGQQRRRRNGR